jgi:hypothetical protein
MGVGKTIVGDTFGQLLGAHYVQVADPRFVTGRFNAHLVSCLLFHLDEAFWAGDHVAEGKLKDLITGKRHPIELKGYEVFFVPNYVRVFINGNADWIVPAGVDERRMATLDVGEDHKQDIPYFRAIAGELSQGGYARLLYELLNFDLSNVDLRLIPRTEALLEQKIASLSAERGWWVDILKRGQLPDCECDPDAPSKCALKVLHDDYCYHAQITGVRRRAIETSLAMFLRRVVPNIASKNGRFHRPQVVPQVERNPSDHPPQQKDWERGTIYTFPPLAECRKVFAAQAQQTIVWEGPSEWEYRKERACREELDVPF